MGFLDSKMLQIVQGVAAAPGDSNSVESPLIVLNLLDNTAGISLAPGGWSPNIPPLESGGVWADSPLSPGRQLLVAQEANVTETMQLIISASSLSGLSKLMSGLNSMLINARSFHTDNAQINPTYLSWWATCYGTPSAGAQYALIYNMDIKYEYQDSPTPLVKATLTIEREPLWRFIPPGANPLQWRFEFYDQPYNYNSSNPPGILGVSTNDLIITPTLQNRSEFSSSFLNTLISNNCITIPANLIPGDAPALMQLFTTNASRPNFIMGKKTVKIPITASSLSIAQNATINFTEGTAGTDFTIAADTGGITRASTGVVSRGEVSFATATNQLRWNIGVVLPNGTINRFIGRWMVFIRCRQSAGTLGDITMYMRYGTTINGDSDGVKLDVVYPPVIAGAGNSTVWGLTYMGIITCPIAPAKAQVNPGGKVLSGGVGDGLDNGNTHLFDLGLFALRSAGAGLLYLADVVLIPVDEGSFTLERADSTISGAMGYDETGYSTRGLPDISVSNGTSAIGTQLVKMSGTGIQLTPNIENKLYYVFYDSSNQSATTDTETFHVNIIPRCRGIRSVKNVNG